MNTFTWPIRVYYEDTDSGGVVYYANYLRFMERARTEWLRSLGVEQDRLLEEEGVIFAVSHASADYLRPARFNDLLQVKSSIKEIRRVSFTFDQSIIREVDGVEICRGEVRVVAINAETFKPCSIPQSIVTEIQSVC